MLEFNRRIIPNIIRQIFERLDDYDQFIARNIIIIDNGLDSAARDKMSYREWMESGRIHPAWLFDYPYSTTKLEGFENCELLPFFMPGHCMDMMETAHVFLSNETGPSFDMHSDDCHVLLYILQGNKTIELVDNIIQLEAGEHFTIRKGQQHRVTSEEGTIALSIGFTGE